MWALVVVRCRMLLALVLMVFGANDCSAHWRWSL